MFGTLFTELSNCYITGFIKRKYCIYNPRFQCHLQIPPMLNSCIQNHTYFLLQNPSQNSSWFAMLTLLKIKIQTTICCTSKDKFIMISFTIELTLNPLKLQYHTIEQRNQAQWSALEHMRHSCHSIYAVPIWPKGPQPITVYNLQLPPSPLIIHFFLQKLFLFFLLKVTFPWLSYRTRACCLQQMVLPL